MTGRLRHSPRTLSATLSLLVLLLLGTQVEMAAHRHDPGTGRECHVCVLKTQFHFDGVASPARLPEIQALVDEAPACEAPVLSNQPAASSLTRRGPPAIS